MVVKFTIDKQRSAIIQLCKRETKHTSSLVLGNGKVLQVSSIEQATFGKDSWKEKSLYEKIGLYPVF